MIRFFTTTASIFLLSYIPGRILTSFFKWDYRLRFAASFGISYFLYYLFGMIQFIFPVTFQIGYVVLSVILLLLGVSIIRNKSIGIKNAEFKLLFIFFLAYFFLVCYQGILPYYSGGGSYWDWFEYYYRGLFFFNKLPLYTVIGTSLLPQRLPLFNAATSFYFSIFGSGFWIFQSVSTLFNITAILSCFLISSNFIIKNKKYIITFILISVILLLNPHFVYQVLYPWTKALASYYVLMGLGFLLMYWKENRVSYMYFSFAFLAMGNLVHLIVLPYVGVLCLFFLIIILKRNSWRRLFLAGCLYLVIISTWYIWSYKTYGAKLTFSSSQVYVQSKDIPVLKKISYFVGSSIYTLIPYPAPVQISMISDGKNNPVFLYDFLHLFYSPDLEASISITMTISLLFYFIVFVARVIEKKIQKIILKKEYLVMLFFVLSGFAHYINYDGYSGAAGLYLLPSTLLIICFGVRVILYLVKAFNRKFLILLTILVIIESAIGLGYKAYTAKYLLDPKINRTINFEKDLYSLPIPDRYRGFAVHLQNYKLKMDNNVVYLYDRFANLQWFFISVLIVGWFVLIFTLFKSLEILSVP